MNFIDAPDDTFNDLKWNISDNGSIEIDLFENEQELIKIVSPTKIDVGDLKEKMFPPYLINNPASRDINVDDSWRDPVSTRLGMSIEVLKFFDREGGSWNPKLF